ncbi:MAG: response regulator [Ignavibacteriales bacterium]|nr:response regulator [Ignavibacteriales bacterium]
MITQKILVVDDEENVCQSIKKVLSRKGYNISQAFTVDDAVKLIKEMTFDLVITDMMIPGTSGLELLQIIRDDYPELEVIMITGYASIESAVKATKLGASAYLPKPFTPDELTKVTEKTLAARVTSARRKASEVPEQQEGEIEEGNIDIDMPFNAREVAKQTSREYVETLTHTDVPLPKKGAAKEYCFLGQRECRKLVLDGKECAGECPILKKEKARASKSTSVRTLSNDIIDVDLPFNLAEVERITGSDYINCLTRSDIPLAGLYGKDPNAKYSVLVVDDEPIVCHSIRKILSKQSCAVEEAFDVDSAMLKLKIQSYDLVLLDLKMPKRSGMEVLKSIRTQYPDVPVIMVTGHGTIETAIEATKFGAFDFIPKPFTPQELTKVAVEALAA